MEPGEPKVIREIFPNNVLSQDERHILEGLPYKDLPQSIMIGDRTMQACHDVWKAFREAKVSPRLLEARQRLIDYYTPLAKAGDYEALQWLRANVEIPQVETEFAQQFYSYGQDIIVGGIHRGGYKQVVSRNSLDGLPDNTSVVNIHNHLNNLTFLEPDIISQIALLDSIPDRCLYFAVGSDVIHCSFPTLDTPRFTVEELRKRIIGSFEERYQRACMEMNDWERAQIDLIRGISEEYRLGYYISNKTNTFISQLI